MTVEQIKAVGEAFTPLVVLIGAAWTLYLFYLQRAREAFVRLDIEMVACERNDGAPTSTIIKVRATNVGKAGLGQRLSWMELRPVKEASIPIGRVQLYDTLRTERPIRVTIFENHTYLEPGEDFVESLLLHAPESYQYLEIHTFFSGQKYGQTWHTPTVVRLKDK